MLDWLTEVHIRFQEPCLLTFLASVRFSFQIVSKGIEIAKDQTTPHYHVLVLVTHKVGDTMPFRSTLFCYFGSTLSFIL